MKTKPETPKLKEKQAIAISFDRFWDIIIPFKKSCNLTKFFSSRGSTSVI